jgi:hypothetical protein
MRLVPELLPAESLSLWQVIHQHAFRNRKAVNNFFLPLMGSLDSTSVSAFPGPAVFLVFGEQAVDKIIL